MSEQRTDPSSHRPDVPDEGLDQRGLREQERPYFPHPEWTVGVVLVVAVVMLLLGILGHPLWLLIGSPFILTLLTWVVVRMVERRRRRRDG